MGPCRDRVNEAASGTSSAKRWGPESGADSIAGFGGGIGGVEWLADSGALELEKRAESRGGGPGDDCGGGCLDMTGGSFANMSPNIARKSRMVDFWRGV